MTLSLLDYKNKTFTLTGQHEAVIICRADGECEITDTNDLGLFVGFEPDISEFIDEVKIRLEPGDQMVLYTDGLTEAVNEDDEEFGLRRLCEAVRRNSGLPAKGILDNVMADLYAYIGSAKIHDDISLMVIKQE